MSELKTDVKPLKVEQATELAAFWNIPQSLVNLFWVDFAGTAYAKEPFLLHMAHKRGVQSIELKEIKSGPEEWEFECIIHPLVTSRMMESLARIPDSNERAKYWDYLTKPTAERAKASRANVRMSTMHVWLREIAVKRAVARTCRL
ncbi:MAG: hypothetical protein ACREBQ_12575, partial [Nitrososphaerales archaeon]